MYPPSPFIFSEEFDMEKVLMMFALILCWALFTINALLVVLKMYAEFTYEGSVTQMVDRMQGQRTVWRAGWNAIIALVTGAFLIAYYVAS